MTTSLRHGRFLIHEPTIQAFADAVLARAIDVETGAQVWAVLRTLPDQPSRVLLVTDDREEASWMTLRARGFAQLVRRMTDDERTEMLAILPKQNPGELEAAFCHRLLTVTDDWTRAKFGRALLDMTEEMGVAMTLAEALDTTTRPT